MVIGPDCIGDLRPVEIDLVKGTGVSEPEPKTCAACGCPLVHLFDDGFTAIWTHVLPGELAIGCPKLFPKYERKPK